MQTPTQRTVRYPLLDGFEPGDVVKLVEKDHAFWKVRRESDCLKNKVYMMAIDRIVEPDVYQ
jgi:hypothetical protein